MAVNRNTFWSRSTALAAALAALAMPVLASAQDDEGRGRMREARGNISRGEDSRPARQPRSDSPSWGETQRRPAQQSTPVAAPAPEPARRGGWSRPDTTTAPAPQPDAAGRRGAWTRPDAAPAGRAPVAGTQTDDGGRRGGWWGGGRSRTPEAVPAPARPDRPASTDRRGAWGSRDGNSTDARREGTYRRDDRRNDDQRRDRDSTRDGGWSDGRRDGDARREDRRGGYRDGARNGTWWEGGRDRRSGDDWRRERRGDDGRRGYREDHRRWDRDWRNDRRYDWNSYRRYNRNHFSIGIYYAPYRNYSYQRISIGYFLDSLFLSNRYWINDPWQYRLPDVYGPYRWVRYYNDVVLVDIYSGEVVDVIHNFFW